MQRSDLVVHPSSYHRFAKSKAHCTLPTLLLRYDDVEGEHEQNIVSHCLYDSLGEICTQVFLGSSHIFTYSNLYARLSPVLYLFIRTSEQSGIFQ